MVSDCMKKLVASYDVSDYNDPRQFSTDEIINGRKYTKHGRYTATTFVGNVWELDCPSDEPFKYLLMVGMSRQHPNERQGSRSAGVELAAERSFSEPLFTMPMMTIPTYSAFVNICNGYLTTVPCEFVRTKQEEKELEINRFVNSILGPIAESLKFDRMQEIPDKKDDIEALPMEPQIS